MNAYASTTNTRRNLRALRTSGWRLLLSPIALNAHGFAYALDNGAWGASQRGEVLDEVAFGRAVEKRGADADFVVVPDIVAGGLRSLDFSLMWLPRLRGCRQRLLAVQDGMTPRDVTSLLSTSVGIFLGGSTPWKLATMQQWGTVARGIGCYFHVGRVNTARRIRACHFAGAHSFDGTSATRYAVNLPGLDAARADAIAQGRLFYA